jgi:hypothetical protein
MTKGDEMTTLKSTIALLVLLTMWSCRTHVQGISQIPDKELSTELGTVNVSVLVSSYPNSQACNAPSSWRWGAENTCPRTYVCALKINSRGEALFVPLSAFADLGNPRTVHIEPREGKGSFAVILIGGEAATSYSARLEFNNDLLRVREVHHGEFPSEAWEKTHYKFNIGNQN